MLEKQTYTDEITVKSDGQLQIRLATSIFEDEVIINTSYFRYVLEPGQDISDQPQSVNDIASIVWTQEVIDAYRDKQEALNDSANL